MPGGGPVFELIGDLYTIRIDYANSTTNYYGYASPGSASSLKVWAIKRETLDAQGRTTSIVWANGNANRDNIWDDRTTLTYP